MASGSRRRAAKRDDACMTDPDFVGARLLSLLLSSGHHLSLPTGFRFFSSHHRFRPSYSTSSKLGNCIALRIVTQPLEEAVAQSDHCIVLIDQDVANGSSHSFRNVGLSSRLTFTHEAHATSCVPVSVRVLDGPPSSSWG